MASYNFLEERPTEIQEIYVQSSIPNSDPTDYDELEFIEKRIPPEFEDMINRVYYDDVSGCLFKVYAVKWDFDMNKWVAYRMPVGADEPELGDHEGFDSLYILKKVQIHQVEENKQRAEIENSALCKKSDEIDCSTPDELLTLMRRALQLCGNNEPGAHQRLEGAFRSFQSYRRREAFSEMYSECQVFGCSIAILVDRLLQFLALCLAKGGPCTDSELVCLCELLPKEPFPSELCRARWLDGPPRAVPAADSLTVAVQDAVFEASYCGMRLEQR